jgi:hypothetical protein
MNRIFAVAALSVLTVSAVTAPGAHGQATNSGDIRGTVTDATGAVVPDVTVTVTNLDTGVTKVLKTNGSGLYDTNSIVVGRYSINFERQGFEKFSRPSVTLQVGSSTVNAILQVGTTSDTVTINTDLPLLDTDSNTQQTTLDAQSMQQLPNVGQDWENFAILIPGSAGLRGNTNPGQLISANGNLPYSNVLSDGASTTLGSSANSDVNIFETVQEVQISTSTVSAQYGIGGIIFNQITKGGTSRFHGSVYDYFQSSEFNANGNYIFPHGSAHPIARYRYNNYGASVGGPILIPHTGLAHKAFFYFDYDRIVNNGTAQGTNDIPTPAVMAGDFSSYINSQTGQPILLYDPTTQTVGIDGNGNTYPIRKTFLSEYGKNAIPAALMDKVALNFQKLYPTPTNHIAGGVFQPGTVDGEGIVHKNFFAQVPVQSPAKRWTGRIDYDTNARNRVTFSMVQGDAPGFSPNEVTAYPVGYGSTDITRLNTQVTDVLTISPHLINEARFGFTYQGNFFADLSYGANYPSQLGLQYAKANEVPGVQFYQNYPYAWIQPSSGQFIYKENVFDPSDVVTFIKGKHVMHFGGEVGIYRNDNTPYNSIQPGTFGFQGNYTAQYTVNGTAGQRNYNSGADYADFLLGYVNNWSASIAQEYGQRLKDPQIFFQDDYKVRPNLTLNLGLRYQIRIGMNEVHGNVGTYDPTVTNPANGQLGAYWFGVTHANGRTGLQDNKYSTILPRVGFAYLPNPAMTIRGGFGVYAYNLSIDTYGSLNGTGLGLVNQASGNGSDQSNGTLPYTTFQGPGVTNQGPTGTAAGAGAALPFASPGTSPTRFNGQSVGYIAYQTPDPKIYQWNLGIEQAIGPNMAFELSYVASHAFDLNFQTDINQVPVADNVFNSQKYRPNQNYQQINGSTNDGISNYNSLQAQLNRRLVHGLSFAASYTWSHFLDNQDSSGFGSRSGPVARQYQTPAQNYGPSNFDIRNQFKARIVYDLPIGKGRAYFNQSRLVDEIFGGYQLSTTVQLSSGNPFSVFSPTSDGSEPGSSPNPFPDYTGKPLYPAHKTVTEWFDPAAFAIPLNPNGFGNVPRNALVGPGYQLVDLSAGKKFDIFESVKLQLRVDATNALNHPNFSIGNTILGMPTSTLPGTPFSQAGFGTTNQISSLDSARTLQGGLRLEF